MLSNDVDNRQKAAGDGIKALSVHVHPYNLMLSLLQSEWLACPVISWFTCSHAFAKHDLIEPEFLYIVTSC